MRGPLFTLVCWLTLVLLAALQEVWVASNKITGPNILSILADDRGPNQADATGKTFCPIDSV